MFYADTFPPKVNITAPESGSYTNNNKPLIDLSYSDIGSGVDTSSIEILANEQPLDLDCDAKDDEARCIPGTALPDGKTGINARVKDYAGNVSEPAKVTFTVDTVPPTITVTRPANGAFTNQPRFTVTGSLSETASLTINGTPVIPNLNLGFSYTADLTEGANSFELTATDLAGNTASIARTVTLDTVPPPPPSLNLISVAGPDNNGIVTVTGKPGAVEATDTITLTNTRTGQSVTVTAGADGSFTATIAAQASDKLTITATDEAGNAAPASEPIDVSNLPPDPAAVAPPLSQTGLTPFVQQVAFLYSGANPIQTGVTPGTIEARRVAVIRGLVLDSAGNPLGGATITVKDHPEFGKTLSRVDGRYDLAVNGGSRLIVVYNKKGYIPVQRAIQTTWLDYASVDDVVLIKPDSKATTVNFGASSPLQIAKGSIETDSDGSRQAVIMFPQGTTATMLLADGSLQPISAATVRATEFTVGLNGSKRMPAKLPPASAYTYAVDLSIDQAVTAGATAVRFNQPVPVYVNNFLGLPPGAVVPAGYYDPAKSAWIPSQDGLVIKILDINANGLADLDIGGGAPATADQLAALGIDSPERARLASIGKAGDSFWRVPVTHFTDWDFNLGYSSSVNAQLPPNQPVNKNFKISDTKDSNICPGCQINAQSQILGEDIPVTGTAYSLHYSSQTPFSMTRHSEHVVITTATVPTDVVSIELDVDVAGQHIRREFSAEPNQTYTFTWNGLDAYGRRVPGPVTATFQLAYVYRTSYDVFLGNYLSNPVHSWFGRVMPAGQTMAGYAHNGRNEVAATRQWTDTFWSFAPDVMGIDRWSLNIHHAYDPQHGILYGGDGSVRQGTDIGEVATIFAGTGAAGVTGDGGPAVRARIWDPTDVEAAPDGSIYLAMSGCIRKITPDGIIHTYAGMCGKNGPHPTDTPTLATAVSFWPNRIALGRDGSLYIQSGAEILRVTPDQMVYVLAGGGSSDSISGQPAQQVDFWGIGTFTVGNDGSIYLSGSYAHGSGLWHITPDGILHALNIGSCVTAMTIAPNGDLVFSTCDYANRVVERQADGRLKRLAGGGGVWPSEAPLATSAYLIHIDALAYGPRGDLYIQSTNGTYGLSSIERVDARTGVLNFVTGSRLIVRHSEAIQYPGNARPAVQLSIRGSGITVDKAGRLYIPGFYLNRLMVVTPLFAGSAAGSATVVASSDGRQLYKFSPSGRQISTLDARTGKTIYAFQYDTRGYLITIEDAGGRDTIIERNAAGIPTAIVSPNGQRTALTVDSNDYLESVSDPAGNSYHMDYFPSGLLSVIVDPNNHADNYNYDADGRLIKDVDAAGGGWTLTRTDSADGAYTVAMTSGERRTRTFLVQPPSNGDRRQVNTLPDGTVETRLFRQNGTNSFTTPDGTIITNDFGPDPRLGMRAPVIQSQTIKLPSGHTRTIQATHTAPSADISDPLFGFSQLNDTLTVNGRTWRTSFNHNTLISTTTTPAGRTFATTVDSLDRPKEITVPGLAPVDYAYTASGRLDSITIGSDADARETDFAYYQNGPSKGWLQSITDALGRQTSYQYDPAGRVTAQILPDGRVVNYTYDGNGNLTSVTPPSRPVHRFDYTPVDQIADYTPPSVGGNPMATHYAYNKDRQITQITRPDGLSIDFTYNSGGKLETEQTPAGSYRYAYNATTGQLASITAPDAETLNYTWDGFLPAGTMWTGDIHGSVTRGYDNNFWVRSLSVDGEVVNYDYDADGLLAQAGSLAIAHDLENALMTGTTLGGVTTSRSYNRFGEVESVEADYGGNSLYSASYSRDKLGRIVSESEKIAGVSHSYTYSYDGAGRLTAVTIDGRTTSYGYGPNSNRISVNGQPLATYDDQDRLLSYGQNYYTYTANGELLSKTTPAGTTTYTYDVLGNLREVKLSNSTDIQYVIDGQNRRIGKKVNGALVEGFLYQDQLNPVAELDGNGNVIARFVYGTKVNVPDYMLKDGKTYRIVSDHLGSPRLIVDTSTGQVVEQIDYDAWGNVIKDTSPGFQPFGFAGGIYDRDTGLVRFGARDYDPQTGRWTAKDPILFTGEDLTLYSYAMSDPINNIDTSGSTTIPGMAGYSIADLNAMAASAQAQQREDRAERCVNRAFSHEFQQDALFPQFQGNFDPFRSVGNFAQDTGSTIGAEYVEHRLEVRAAAGSSVAARGLTVVRLGNAASDGLAVAAVSLDLGDAVQTAFTMAAYGFDTCPCH